MILEEATISRLQCIQVQVAISLLWDLYARNHEVTMLKIKHIMLRSALWGRKIPHESKLGTGPVLLTCSFPYIRDLNPFRIEF